MSSWQCIWVKKRLVKCRYGPCRHQQPICSQQQPFSACDCGQTSCAEQLCHQRASSAAVSAVPLGAPAPPRSAQPCCPEGRCTNDCPPPAADRLGLPGSRPYLQLTMLSSSSLRFPKPTVVVRASHQRLVALGISEYMVCLSDPARNSSCLCPGVGRNLHVAL